MLGFIIAAGAALAAGGLLRSEYEKKHFVTEKYTIETEQIGRPELNFVFLSDLHSNTFGKKNEKLIAAIDRVKPDGVLIGGDMMVCRGTADTEVTLDLVRSLASRYPVYYSDGNHEERMNRERDIYGDQYDAFRQALQAAGVHYLSDGSIMGPGSVRITGSGMEEAYYRHLFTLPKLPKGEIERRVGKSDGDHYQILLLHSPLFFERARQWGADLTLSGHFHGGTIRLPFLGGVMTPQYQFFLPWCAGRFDEEGKTMIVSRGLGTHSINIRFNNKPQLVWICLKRAGLHRL